MICMYCGTPLVWVTARIVTIRGERSVACADLEACRLRVEARDAARRAGA